MEDEKRDPVLARSVQGIRDAGIKAAELTRQLLAFGRRQVLRPKVLNLNAIVRDVERMLARLIPENIRLVTKLENDLGAVRADSGQIEQVIINLAINARDAMPDGGVLTITTANAELSSTHSRQRFAVRPGRYVMVSVADTGTGMDEETQAHIFEPFYTTKPVGKGTGLGLSVVYGIIKQSNGYIWLYSEPGRGSTFEIYLPRVDEAEEKTPEDTGEKAAAATGTVLLGEDDHAVRELTNHVLKSAGYSVLVSKDVNDALRLCREHAGPIDVLLTDVVMPEMNGFELAQLVRTLRPGIEIVVMTGYAAGAFKNDEALDPTLAFIEKPFTPDVLLRAIRARRER